MAKKNNWNFQLLVLGLFVYYFNQKAAERKNCCESTKNEKTKKGQKKKENYKKQSLCLFVGGWELFFFV